MSQRRDTENLCFPTRIALAGQRVENGEWASGHAIATNLLRCSAQGGCALRDDCAGAAQSLICDIQALLKH